MTDSTFTYEINNIDDLLKACNDTWSNLDNGIYANYVLNINTDIDFGEYSKYWTIESNMFQFVLCRGDLTINGNNHSFKNAYIVNNSLFYIDMRINVSPYPKVYIYDLDFDFILNKNPIDTGSLSFMWCTHSNSPDCPVYLTNCTFRAKLFAANTSNEGNHNNCMFYQGRGDQRYVFKNCIFNIEYYRIFNLTNANQGIRLTRNNMSIFSTAINCQFYIKAYLVDGYSDDTCYLTSFLTCININNCFFMIEAVACNSSIYFDISRSDITFYNTYFVLKKNKNVQLEKPFKLYIQAGSGSSINNYYCIDDPDDDTLSITCTNTSAFKELTPTQAKDSKYLLQNLGFVIKDNS